jgi:hypothetical protein
MADGQRATGLAAAGMTDTGTRVLAPGECWETTVPFTPPLATS